MNEKILVIDDEPGILYVFKELLTTKGFKVKTASGGEEGLELFKSEPFDLVVTDIRMPKTDGLEVMKQVRQISDDAEIIIMTGFPSVDIAVRALKDYRAYDFLIKPLKDISRFSATVTQALERSQLRKEKKSLLEALTKANTKLKQEIKERKQTEEALLVSKAELEIKTRSLEETNTALKVLLKQRNEDKKELEQQVLFNVKELIWPNLEKLKRSRLDDTQKNHLNIIESNLNDIVSPFLQGVGPSQLNLTPQEIQIANLVRQGKSTKEIAELMKLSPRTIETHRNSIRKKMGLKNEKVNLRTYLLSIQ